MFTSLATIACVENVQTVTFTKWTNWFFFMCFKEGNQSRNAFLWHMEAGSCLHKFLPVVFILKN